MKRLGRVETNASLLKSYDAAFLLKFLETKCSLKIHSKCTKVVIVDRKYQADFITCLHSFIFVCIW
jgi:hypothetical protein